MTDPAYTAQMEHELGMCGGKCPLCVKEARAAAWRTATQAAHDDDCPDCEWTQVSSFDGSYHKQLLNMPCDKHRPRDIQL